METEILELYKVGLVFRNDWFYHEAAVDLEKKAAELLKSEQKQVVIDQVYKTSGHNLIVYLMW